MIVNGDPQGLLGEFYTSSDSCTSQSAASVPADCDPDNEMGGYGEKIWKDPVFMKYSDATRLDSRETGTAIFVRFQDSLMLWKEYDSDFSEKAAQRDA